MPLKATDMMQIMERYDKEEECRQTLAELRWPNGVECHRCGGKRHAYDSKAYRWDCYSCGYGFTALAGTIFQDTKLPLCKWFMAVLLMVEAKKGISANQVKRTLGVSYKTAWFLCHRIRAAMQDAYPFPLKGTIEVDEAYVVGKVRGKRRGYRDNKAIIVGAVERDGKIVLKVVDGNDRKTLRGFIGAVAECPEAIHTDEHKAEEWARGNVHTNSVENVWSLLKRSIMGSYHKLSLKHLDAYLDELEWRFNNRDNPHIFGDTLRKLLMAENLTYQVLVGE